MTLTERAARYERTFQSLPPPARAELITVAQALVTVIGGGQVPTTAITDLLDLIQNAGAKIARGLKSEAEVLAEIQAGAPTVAAAFLEAIGRKG